MSGIEMWQEAGMGVLDIIGAMWWDILCALVATGWILFLGTFWISSAINEMGSWIRWKDWREILKFIGCGALFIPLIRLVCLVIQIWFLK